MATTTSGPSTSSWASCASPRASQVEFPPERVRDAVLGMLSGRGLAVAVARADQTELTTPPVAQEVIEELERLREQREQAVEAQELDRSEEMRDRERRLVSAAAQLQRAWERRAEERQPPRSPPPVPRPRAAARAFSASARRGDRDIFVGDKILLFAPFLLGALVLGIGLLLGWLIWG